MKSIRTYGVIAIAVFFLATVLNVGINVYDSIAKRDFRLQGDVSHIEIIDPTTEQFLDMAGGHHPNNLDYVKLANMSSLGQVITDSGESIDIVEAGTYWDSIFRPALTNIKGRSPKSANEIMASRNALELLGINDPKVGMEIQLTYSLFVGAKKTETLVLSGFFTDFIHYTQKTPRVFCSSKLISGEIRYGGVSIWNIIFVDEDNISNYAEKLKQEYGFSEEQIVISPAFSSAFDDVDANVFTLDFYPAIYIGAVVLAVIIMSIKRIVGRKGAIKSRGGKK